MGAMKGHPKFWIVPLVILIAAGVIVLLLARPAAPKRIALYAGPEGSTYYTYAQKYAEYLDKKGIGVRIVETSGSIENLRSLAADEEPAAAFALSGLDARFESIKGIEDLETLGCLSLQPFWLFVGTDSEVRDTRDLAGMKVALGQSETDTRALATLVLRENKIEHKIVEPSITQQTPEAMADALIKGDLDAAFLVGSTRSAGVSALLESDAVEPISVRRIDAYTRLHPALGQVVIPEGLYDLAKNLPDRDLHLVAPADNLVVRADLHPAVVDLLLDAARVIHREPTLFGDRGTFPNMRYVSLPLSDAAVRFYEDGPPRWRKLLPYWLATLIDRFALIVAQVGAVVLIFFKGIPAFMKTRFNMKALDLYKRMMRLENGLMAGADWEESLATLDEIRKEIATLKVPRFLLTNYLELCQNVHDIRERMEAWHEAHPVSS